MPDIELDLPGAAGSIPGDAQEEAAMKLLRKLMGRGGHGLPDLEGPDDAALRDLEADEDG